MKLHLVYIILIAGFAALAGNSYGLATETSRRSLEATNTSAQCHHPIVTLAERDSSPFSKSGNEEGGAGSLTISASDAVPHASVTTISPLTFAVVISILNGDKHDRESIVTDPVILTVFHKVLFRAIISPNAP